MQDITGNRYGRWTVIERTDKSTKHDGVKYLCKCDCGTIREVSEKTLIYGKSKSCGCVRKERFSKMVDGMKGVNHPSFKDLTGRRFGFLTAINPTDRKSGSNIVWECKCDCGVICYVPSASLLNGKRTNCGCKRVKDITGQKFGMLTVIEKAGILEHGEMSWKCKCDCGKETVVSGAILRNGSTKSCGCFHKIATQKFRKHNEFQVCGDAVYVILPPKNKQMVCDIEDWEKLSCYCWFEDKNGYAYANVNMGGKKMYRFHQMLFDAPNGMTVDHINRNKLDNRKENLRVVTITENVLNRGIYRNNKSGARGVTWNKIKKKWEARLTYNKKVMSLGYFDDIEDAKRARLRGEMKYFGALIDDGLKKSH